MDKNDKRWLNSLQKTVSGTPPLATSTLNPIDSFLETYGNRCLGEDEDALVKTTGVHSEESNVPDPVSQMFERSQFDMLAKRQGIEDFSWESQISVMAESKRSLFEKACRRVFAAFPELAEEAICLGSETVSQERAAILAEAAA